MASTFLYDLVEVLKGEDGPMKHIPILSDSDNVSTHVLAVQVRTLESLKFCHQCLKSLVLVFLLSRCQPRIHEYTHDDGYKAVMP